MIDDPHAERFVKTIKHKCLKHFVISGERHLRYLVKELVDRHQTKRFYQGIGGQLIKKPLGPANDNGANDDVARRSRLDCLLKSYHREAAWPSTMNFWTASGPRIVVGSARTRCWFRRRR